MRRRHSFRTTYTFQEGRARIPFYDTHTRPIWCVCLWIALEKTEEVEEYVRSHGQLETGPRYWSCWHSAYFCFNNNIGTEQEASDARARALELTQWVFCIKVIRILLHTSFQFFAVTAPRRTQDDVFCVCVCAPMQYSSDFFLFCIILYSLLSTRKHARAQDALWILFGGGVCACII